MGVVRPGSFRPRTRFSWTGHAPGAGRPEPGSVSGWFPWPFPRQQIARMLRRAGLEDAAADALTTLPDSADAKDIEQFCATHGLSAGSLMDRLGGSP